MYYFCQKTSVGQRPTEVSPKPARNSWPMEVSVFLVVLYVEEI
jgi:hypothetical protein